MFVARCLYLSGDGSHKDKVINVYVSALTLNRLCMQNKRTHVHCPRTFVWYSLLLLVMVIAINVCAVHANLSCRCLQTHEIFKILDRSYTCDAPVCFKYKSSCNVCMLMHYVHTYICSS